MGGSGVVGYRHVEIRYVHDYENDLSAGIKTRDKERKATLTPFRYVRVLIRCVCFLIQANRCTTTLSIWYDSIRRARLRR